MVDPMTKAVTVVPHLELRLRSPSGVMLASIDSPQGDHADRMAAARANPNATTMTVASAVIIGFG
jgi:hypothetical protein